MRFRRLDLRAYGPFTDVTLDLSGGHHGLHLIYGPNEAGKSSTLQAVLEFLFGFHGQTPADFLHPYGSLRVGAVVEGAAGALECVRRKANANALRAADDQAVVEEAALRRFLPVESRGQFESMFGINHARLVDGGRALLKGEGEFGALLFAASTGVTHLHAVQRELADACDDLYGKRKGALRDSLKAMRELQERLTGLQTLPNDYVRLRDEREGAYQAAATASAELADLEREAHRLERLHKALAPLARRRQLLAALEPLRLHLVLPGDFEKRFQEARRAHQEAEQNAREAAAEVGRLEAAVQAIAIPSALLAQATVLKSLHERLGAHRSAAGDMPKRLGQLRQVEGELADLLKDMRVGVPAESVSNLLPTRGQRDEVSALAERGEAIRDAVRSRRAKWEESRASVERTRHELSELAPLADCSGLLRALLRARNASATDELVHTQAAALARDEQRRERQLAGLPGWEGSWEQLESAPVPAPSTLDRHAKLLQKLEGDEQRFQGRLEELRSKLADLEKRSQELARQREVPTLEEVRARREERATRWLAVRRVWLDGEPPQALPAHLAERYEASVTQADATVDRVRQESEHVAAQGQLARERDELHASIAKGEQKLAELRQRRAEADQEWLQEWAAACVPARSPSEMADWLRARSAILELAREVDARRPELDKLASRLNEHRSELDHELRSLGESGAWPQESFGALLARAQELADRHARERQSREKRENEMAFVQRDLPGLEEQVRQAERELAQWTAGWAAAVQPLSLPPEASTAQARLRLNQWNDLERRLHDAHSLRSRLEAMERDAERFERDVTEFVHLVAPGLVGWPADMAVSRLQDDLQQAKVDSSRRDEFARQEAREQERLAREREAARRARATLDELCRLAGCAEPNAVPERIRLSEERRSLEAELHALEERLSDLCGHGTLDDLAGEAAAVDADEVPGRISELRDQADGVRQRRSECDRQCGAMDDQLRRLETDDEACHTLQQIQEQRARVQRQVEQYARLRMAALVLRGAIERYRARHEGTLLARSSDLFRRLTCASFQELRLDWDERSRATLQGLRADGRTRVGVEGMSDGTRDQLYLALRLASLEAYFERHEPVPFIVDDILLNFDDQRSAATLAALEELSVRTQVLFFTHNRHLVELAERTVTGGRLFVHDLARARAARS